MMLMVRAVVACLAASSIAVAPAGAQPGPVRHAGADPVLVEQVLGIRAFTVQRLETIEAEPGVFEAPIVLGDQRVVVRAAPHSVRDPAFQVLVQGADGELRRVEPPVVTTYRGDLPGIDGSAVAFSRIGGSLSGVVLPGDGSMWGMEPLSLVVPGADPALHVVYHRADVTPMNGICGNDIVPGLGPFPGDVAGEPADGTRGTGLRQCDIAFDADVEFYNLNGGSVSATVRDIEGVMNNVEAIYERDTGITYEITTIIVRTSESDPYSSSDPGTLLSQFRAEWNANQTDIRRDIAHLMTGRQIDGSVIGIAYLSVICSSSNGYGLSQSRFTTGSTRRACLTAHELGHNWSAQHCDGDNDCWIMCSGLGGCGRNCTRFGSRSIATITSYRNTRTCLADLADPRPLPFFDGFDNGTINTANWSYANGVAVSTGAVDEPSPPYSLAIDAVNPRRQDEIRTNEILAAGAPPLELSFWYQAAGPEAGEALVVDYFTSALTWVELSRIVSDGVGQQTFTRVAIPLPQDAAHAALRVRFRADVNAPGDTWFVDSVRVGEPEGTECAADFNGDGTVDSDDFFDFLNAYNAGDPSADFNGDGTVDSDDFFDFLNAYNAGC